VEEAQYLRDEFFDHFGAVHGHWLGAILAGRRTIRGCGALGSHDQVIWAKENFHQQPSPEVAQEGTERLVSIRVVGGAESRFAAEEQLDEAKKGRNTSCTRKQ